MAENKIGKLSDPVVALADHLRAVATTSTNGIIDSEVKWDQFTSISAETQKALLEALRHDLYIGPDEDGYIMETVTSEDRPFVNKLLANLKNQPPLFSRAEYLLSQTVSLFSDKNNIVMKVRDSLERVTIEESGFHGGVQKTAQILYDKMLSLKVDEER